MCVVEKRQPLSFRCESIYNRWSNFHVVLEQTNMLNFYVAKLRTQNRWRHVYFCDNSFLQDGLYFTSCFYVLMCVLYFIGYEDGLSFQTTCNRWWGAEDRLSKNFSNIKHKHIFTLKVFGLACLWNCYINTANFQLLI